VSEQASDFFSLWHSIGASFPTQVNSQPLSGCKIFYQESLNPAQS
jgi:hypothetical protein